MNITAYETDVVAWANEQAALIRAGRFELLDLQHIAEEIEDVGKSEKRELAKRLSAFLADLLKWKYQPQHRGSNCAGYMGLHRKIIRFHLKEAPSLQAELSDMEWIDMAWSDAVVIVLRETELEDLPEICPWKMDDVLRDGWLPV